MRSDRLAETLLSMVAPAERAAAAVGDLLEEAPQRGWRWFWTSVLRTGLACVSRHILDQPWQMAFYAAVAWFAYMLVFVLVLVAGHVSVSVLWLTGDVLANHTGFELLAEPLGWSGDWGKPPDRLLRALDLLAMAVIAPYLTGLRLADVWRERAIAFALALAVTWSLMLTVVPLAGRFGNRVTVAMLAVIVPAMLAGVVRRRLLSVTPDA